MTLPALTTEGVLAFLLAAALAGVAFGAKGGLELERTTASEIAVVLGGALVAALAALIAPTSTAGCASPSAIGTRSA